jgi:uncharacterized membrane protein YtjA (UPF0391 family)
MFVDAGLARPLASLESAASRYRKEFVMLRWALGFFVVAIIAAVFGFGNIAAGASDIARICFFFFIVFFAVSLVWGLATGRRIPPPL